ncbi:replication factor C subunit 3/5 [Strigomonas culicis]|nr:replication factor C subunit 3/5 [Strigomonas culicis]EPY18693.1 replication factor C subunit 3/5 [Strigomonas culicis]|eukprot:EPY18581.1 replication factor C subunit 3/5 [Strigomonas culicis]
MNASDDRGIDVVRNQIREFSSTTSIFSSLGATREAKEGTRRTVPFKLVVLDEADQMSHDAQAALRRVIEKYTKNVRFCVLCNHINKIIPAIQSRCTRFRFAPVRKSAMIPRLQTIAEQEQVTYTPAGLTAAFRLSQGDLRRCLNMMQAASLSFNTITETSMYRVTGNPTREEVSGMVSSMLSSGFCESYASVLASTTLSGVSVMDLVREMHPIVMSMDLPLDCKCFLLKVLSDLEYYAAGGAREACGLGGLVGTFQLVKESVTQRKPLSSMLRIA